MVISDKHEKTTYFREEVAWVSSMLNSATVTPLEASIGANMAAGYTTDDVPTYTKEVDKKGN